MNVTHSLITLSVPRFEAGAPETFVVYSTDGAPRNPIHVETRRRLRELVGPIAMVPM